MKTEIDTEYAPEGYRAKLAEFSARAGALCDRCAFERDPSPCHERPCWPTERPDGTHVIFVKL